MHHLWALAFHLTDLRHSCEASSSDLGEKDPSMSRSFDVLERLFDSLSDFRRSDLRLLWDAFMPAGGRGIDSPRSSLPLKPLHGQMPMSGK